MSKVHRTIFSDFQLDGLEEFYKRCPYPRRNDNYDLGHKLGMDANTVQVWFNNRRAKDKRCGISNSKKKHTEQLRAKLPSNEIIHVHGVDPAQSQFGTIPQSQPNSDYAIELAEEIPSSQASISQCEYVKETVVSEEALPHSSTVPQTVSETSSEDTARIRDYRQQIISNLLLLEELQNSDGVKHTIDLTLLEETSATVESVESDEDVEDVDFGEIPQTVEEEEEEEEDDMENEFLMDELEALLKS